MESIIKTDGLGHKYSTNWAIKNINIDIKQEGAIGLLGSNGAGKSTIMKIMCGVLNQTQGDVYINGINIRKNPLEAKKHLGFLPQKVPLYEDLTAREYLAYCASLRRIEGDKISVAVEEVMDECGISNLKDRLVKNLSGGYRQRVGLAQAIIHRPEVVVLDEPTTGLDPVQIKELHMLIQKIARESTVIISSHILEEIKSVCREIIMIEQGQMVFSDSLEAFENYLAPESLMLTVDSPLPVQQIQSVEGVNRAEKISSSHYRVFFNGKSETSQKLIEESVHQGWQLSELVIEKNSMDDIFKQLTKKRQEANMKQTLKIAKNELYSLYYSPIAWVIMILFLVLTAIDYTNTMSYFLGLADKGYLRYLSELTHNIITREFAGIYSNLYLFFPLITMGLISREKKKGTIKLLYSSPVKIREIVMGKFLAIVAFTLALVGLILLTLIGVSLSLAHPDFGHMVGSLFGLFLVLCTFAAIGLFISSLTSYSVVAAIITFAVFALFSNISFVLNNVAIARDVTFYLNMRARMAPLINGLLNSRDILYFLIICASFLSFTILKLKSSTESISTWKKTGRYVTVIVVAFIIGYVSTRPQLTVYLDSTRDQIHTITPPTQKTLSKLDEGPLHITIFVNLLSGPFGQFAPNRQNSIVHHVLEPYIRFKPNIEIDFIYYYADSKYASTPPSLKGKTLKEQATKVAHDFNMNLDEVLTLEQVKKIYDVTRENNGNFFLLEYQDKQVVVRTFFDMTFWPSEDEWAAGFKRLISQSPKIVFLTGHGERNPYSERRISYRSLTSAKKNRNSLLNQGYTIDTLALQHYSAISPSIAGLAIVDPSEPYSPEAVKKIEQYIESGGNLFITVEPYHRDVIAPILDLLGLSLHKGKLVQSNTDRPANVITTYMTNAAKHLNPQLYNNVQTTKKYRGLSTYPVAMKTATGITNIESNEFEVKPLLKTKEGKSWIRLTPIPKDSLHESIQKPTGRPSGPFITAVKMQRKINGKRQIVIVSSDADYLSSVVHGRYNYLFGFYSFSQFSYGKFPRNTMRNDTDHKFTISSDDLIYQTVAFIYVIPCLMAIIGSIILIRRKRK